MFQKHLREKLGVEEAKVRPVFEPTLCLPGTQEGIMEVDQEEIVAVPAGRSLKDQVMPGADTDQEGWGGTLFTEMLKKSVGDSKVALLRY